MLLESIKWRTSVEVEHYTAEQAEWVTRKTGLLEPQGWQFRDTGCPPESVTRAEGNVLTYSGAAWVMSLLTGNTSTVAAFTLSNGFLPVGVGDGNGIVPATSATDTDLTAPLNKYYQPVDASYPTVGAAGSGAGVLTVQATYGGTVANFAWNECALFGLPGAFTGGSTTTPPSSTIINHMGKSLGTKASGNIWTLVLTSTIS